MYSNRKRFRSKLFYKGPPSKKRSCRAKSIQNGHRGFLVTTNGYEKRAILEMFNLLEEACSDCDVNVPSLESCCDEESSTFKVEDDILESLKEELEEMKGTHSKRHQKFISVNSGARGVLFITCSDDIQPCELAHKIFKKLSDKNKPTIRYCVRLTPVSVVCPANIDDIKRNVKDVFKEFHNESSEPLKYCIVYKARNNSSIDQSKVESTLVDVVTLEGQYPHKADLISPDRVVIVEIIKSHCCVSVVKDYFHFKKYNLQEVLKDAIAHE